MANRTLVRSAAARRAAVLVYPVRVVPMRVAAACRGAAR